MSEEPPPPPQPPLGYADPRAANMARPPRHTLTNMAAGFGAGTIFSLLVWGAGWNVLMNDNRALGTLVLVPLIKIASAVTLLCVPRWRAYGGGVLLSLTLGALIFFGVCAAHM